MTISPISMFIEGTCINCNVGGFRAGFFSRFGHVLGYF